MQLMRLLICNYYFDFYSFVFKMQFDDCFGPKKSIVVIDIF